LHQTDTIDRFEFQIILANQWTSVNHNESESAFHDKSRKVQDADS